MYINYGNFKIAGEDLRERLDEEGNQVGNTIELTNVAYTVTKPRLEDLTPRQPWADKEFEDRVSMDITMNPGNAWELLPEVWEPMLEAYKSGNITKREFSYTYATRMAQQLGDIVLELKGHHDSRQAYLSIWKPEIDSHRLSRRRVPCTLGYQFLIRDNKFHITYLQRSSNFLGHYQDDVYLAVKLQQWMADRVGVTPGTFSHWIGSFHIFTHGGFKHDSK